MSSGTNNADPDDPMRVTDETRNLGLVVRALMPFGDSITHCRQLLHCVSLHCACCNELSYLTPCLQVCRGTAVTVVAPTAGTEEIANPFLPAEEES